MSTKYKFHNPEGIYFVTYTVIGWIDVFTKAVYKDILIESWKYCIEQKGLIIHAFVIMTNHVHMIISRSKAITLEAIMRDMKKFTSSQIIKAIKTENDSRKEWMLSNFLLAGNKNSNNTSYQFWQQDNHPLECDTPAIFQQKKDYIHENPVKAGFVAKPEDWIYSSATDYFSSSKGLIEISLVW